MISATSTVTLNTRCLRVGSQFCLSIRIQSQLVLYADVNQKIISAQCLWVMPSSEPHLELRRNFDRWEKQRCVIAKATGLTSIYGHLTLLEELRSDAKSHLNRDHQEACRDVNRPILSGK